MRRWFFASFLFLSIVAAFCMYAYFPRPDLAVMANSHRFDTLVIDPGHGGEDGGAVSAIGRKESEVNLSIGRKMRDLAALLGIPCVMTREDDRSLHTVSGTVAQQKLSDLQYRVDYVNSIPNALLVSVHQNHFPQGKYHGSQVFYAHTDSSEDLARHIQQMLRETLDTTNQRAVKPCKSIYLMERVRCPAVLVECGFLSNPSEEELLHDANYQKKIAAAVISVVYEYKSEANEIDQV